MPTDDSNTSSASSGSSPGHSADGASAPKKSRSAPKAAPKSKAVAKPKASAAKAAPAPAPPTPPAAKAKAAPKKVAGKQPNRPGDLHRAAERLKQVSDPTRLRVLLALSQSPRNVTQLRDELGGISQPALSHHLALLRHGRLIEPSRQGKTNVYDLTNAGRELAEVVGKLMP